MNDLYNLIKEGYISRTKHPDHKIYILNYTSKTQYECFWNETTKACRGLIVDSNNNPISRCFKKFFNYKEVKKEVDFLLQKKENFTIFEKYDGSLGISYFLDGRPNIATRGSFTSQQAIKANKILKSKYTSIKLDPDLTYLFEIIYPENRIVLDYGQTEDLVLLAVIDTKTNEELDLDLISNNFGFNVCKKYSYSLEHILTNEIDNFEGYVVRFDNGFRFKVKLMEYVRLHKLIFGLSSKNIWESLKEEKSLDLQDVPDEIFNWIKDTKNKIVSEYQSLEQNCKQIFRNLSFLQDRKKFAEIALKSEYYPILFRMYDNKSYKDLIWEKVKPNFYTFKEDNDE